MKTLFKSILIIVFLAGVIGAGSYFLVLPQLSRNDPAKSLTDELFGWKYPVAKFPTAGSEDQIAYSSIRDPGGIAQGLPVRLKIPTIGVDTAIEDALITPDGRMDVPAGSVNVAWFALGPHPGKVGSAVIGGHFGIDNGVPKVFFNLNKLKAGDKVYVVDDKGDTLAFVVRKISLFDRNADATTVFTSEDGIAHLNIITCEGIWNKVNDTYPERRVVFTDAIAAEGAVVVNKSAAVAAKPKTTTAPKIEAKTTPIAEAPPADESTTAPDSAPKAEVALPSTAKNLPTPPQILTASVKSLYASPIDGLVTSLLLISIVFIAFKIIRR